jgi:STE24 endopeptidase
MEPLFTPEQLAEIKAYHLPGYIRSAVDPFLYVGLLLFTLVVLIRPLHRGAEASARWLDVRLAFLRTAPVSRAFFKAMDLLWKGPGWGTALLFALYFHLLHTLLYTPADIYFEYILEHRFGMSSYTPLTYTLDTLKGLVLESLVLCLLVVGMYGLARRVNRWWLVLGVPAALILLVASALDPYRGRVYFDQTPLPEGPLRASITDLMKRADITFADVVVEKTSVASKRVNAYFAGQGPTRTIVLNDVLLEKLDEPEILAVVAHEAGHLHEPQWPGRLASSALLLTFLFIIHRVLRHSARRGWFGTTDYADIRTLPLVFGLVFLVFTFAFPISGAFSRSRELEADRYAVRLIGDTATFRRMLVKATRLNKMDPEPPRWFVYVGMTHPPLGERLSALSTP